MLISKKLAFLWKEMRLKTFGIHLQCLLESEALPVSLAPVVPTTEAESFPVPSTGLLLHAHLSRLLHPPRSLAHRTSCCQMDFLVMRPGGRPSACRSGSQNPEGRGFGAKHWQRASNGRWGRKGGRVRSWTQFLNSLLAPLTV